MSAPADKPRAQKDAIGSFCVWTKTGRRPQFYHPTKEQAEAEALRLAAKRPGKRYVVMQVTGEQYVAPESAST